MKEQGSRRYTVKGTTQDVISCERCGRTDLLRTVVLVDNMTDEIVHFGTECAAAVAGYTFSEVSKLAKDADAEARRIEIEARSAKVDAETKSWERWLVEQTGIEDTLAAIQALGGFAAARAAYRA